jgi:hypothetical protein
LVALQLTGCEAVDAARVVSVIELAKKAGAFAVATDRSAGAK